VFRMSNKLQLIGSSFFAQTMRIFTTMVMARFIGPTEQGAYFLVLIVSGFVGSLGDFFIPQSLVQMRGFSDQTLLDTGLLLEGGIFVFYGLFTIGGGMVLSHMHGDPRLWKLAVLVALANALNAFYSVQLANLNRNLQFRSESRQNIIFSVSSAVAGIILALLGWGAFALAMQLLVAQILANIALSIRVPLRWPRQCSWAAAKRYLKLGFPMSMAGYVGNVEGSIVGMVINSVAGETGVGLWGKTVQVQQLFAQNIMAAFQRVAYPLICRATTNPSHMKKLFVRVTITLMLVSIPLTVVVALNSPAIIRVVMGSQWMAAAPLLRITAWAIPAGALACLGYMLCMALGITGSVFRASALNIVVFVPLLLVARRWEMAGLAVCWSLSRYLIACSVLVSATRRLGVQLRLVWRQVSRLAVAGAAGAAAMFALIRIIPPQLVVPSHIRLPGELALSCLVGAAAYGLVVLLIEREALAYAWRMARGSSAAPEDQPGESEQLQALAAAPLGPADSADFLLTAGALGVDGNLQSKIMANPAESQSAGQSALNAAPSASTANPEGHGHE